jgi:poly-beta-hydroxybutyrate-responsive repressor
MSESEGTPEPKRENVAPQNQESLPTPSTWLEPALLIPMLVELNSYGYRLMDELARFGFEAINPGTLYRTLRRLEHNGHLKSDWQTTGNGPARRVYSLTQAGEAYLDWYIEALKQHQQVMNTIFQLYTDGRQRRAREQEQG